jgi:hypothetical protein
MRNFIAKALRLAHLRKQVVQSKKVYSRKGRAVTKQFVDGSFYNVRYTV